MSFKTVVRFIQYLSLLLVLRSNNCFIKKNQEILLYLADFALQEQFLWLLFLDHGIMARLALSSSVGHIN